MCHRANRLRELHHCRLIVPLKGIYPIGIKDRAFLTGSASSLPLMTLIVLLVLLLNGCTTSTSDAGSDTPVPLESRTKREHRLQSLWKGRPYNALLETYGAPKMVMSLPGYRAVTSSVVVFGVIDKASDCVDAFTIESLGQNGEMMVSDYYCR